MTRIFLISVTVLAFVAGVAHGNVTYNGHPVRVAMVGQIDASPCSDPRGCLRAVVELRFHGRHSTRVVRCGHPKHLRVVRAFRDSGERWADVFACSKHYVWRLP